MYLQLAVGTFLCYRLLWGVLHLALLLIAAVPGATTRHDPHRVL